MINYKYLKKENKVIYLNLPVFLSKGIRCGKPQYVVCTSFEGVMPLSVLNLAISQFALSNQTPRTMFENSDYSVPRCSETPRLD